MKIINRTCRCGNHFKTTHHSKMYCEPSCQNRFSTATHRKKVKDSGPAPINMKAGIVLSCIGCDQDFAPISTNQCYCTPACRKRNRWRRRQLVKKEANAAAGKAAPWRSHKGATPYSPDELRTLWEDPRATLPGRTLSGIWQACIRLGIPRDPDMEPPRVINPENRNKKKGSSPIQRKRYRTMYRHRRNLRKNERQVCAELFRLAGRHPDAASRVAEAFLILMDRVCTPAEALQQARANVNREDRAARGSVGYNDAFDHSNYVGR